MSEYTAYISETWRVGDERYKLVLVRAYGDGTLDYASFHVDPLCLGAVEADWQKGSDRQKLEEVLEATFDWDDYEEIDAYDGKRVLLEAVKFAAASGFNPPGNYEAALCLFKGVDETRCRLRFFMGIEGKPWFVPPEDADEAFVKQVLATLTAHRGPKGFIYHEDDEARQDPTFVS